MWHSTGRPWKKVSCFYALTLVFSTPFWWTISNSSPGLWPFAGLMWSPALAALLTQLAFRDSWRELGLSFKGGRLQLLAYVLPFLYATPVYLTIWLGSQRGFEGSALGKTASARYPDMPLNHALALFVLVAVTVGFLDKASRALGEEIGWRGFLVPELAKVTSFTGVGLISGLMWALWHFPLILFGTYRSKAPVWYALLCFTVMIIAWAIVAAWLRLRSGSVWPTVILHSSHNALVQLVLNPLTIATEATVYLIDEFGAGLALGSVCVAAYVWLHRNRVPTVERDA